jgi:hypothetical protein
MSLNMLLQQVRDAVREHTDQQNQQTGKCDSAGLLAQIETLFEQHQQQFAPQYRGQPEGMDPYGGLPDESGQFEQSGVGAREEASYGASHAAARYPNQTGAGL